jgi:hypothetical protein
MSDDLHRQFGSLSRQLAGARKKVEQTYFAWTAATREMNLLERQQSEIFGRMVCRAGDNVTVGLPEAQKTL